jgi:exosortase
MKIQGNINLKPESLVKSLIYSSVLVALYHNTHRLLFKWWQREDYNYCYLIPIIVLYLIWEKRDILIRIPSKITWLGFFPVLIGLGLFWLGELGGEYYTLYISSWFLLVGLCWMHLGWEKFKVILFPIALILTMFPPPNFIYYNLSLKLKLISSKLGVSPLAGKLINPDS